MDPVVWWMLFITLITNCAMFGAYIWSYLRIEQAAGRVMFRLLEDPDRRKQLVMLFTNKKTMDMVTEELFSRLKAGLYGMLGKEKQAEKKVLGMLQEEMAQGALEETGLAPLLDLLPKRMRESLQKNPTLLAAGLRILGPYLAQRLQGNGDGVNYLSQ